MRESQKCRTHLAPDELHLDRILSQNSTQPEDPQHITHSIPIDTPLAMLV